MESNAIAIRARPELPALKMDKVEFLKEFAPVKIVEKYSGVTNVLQAAKAEIPTLRDIENTYGRTYVLGYLTMWMVELGDFLDLKKPTEQQLKLSASAIFDKHKTLNLADLKLITEEILTGEVPLTAVRSDKLCPLLERYWQRRCLEHQEHNDAQQKIITLKTLDEETLLQGYHADLSKRVAEIEEREAKAARELDAIRAKAKVAAAIIERHKKSAQEGAGNE